MPDHIQDLITNINTKYLERDAREERKRFPISPSTLGNCSRSMRSPCSGHRGTPLRRACGRWSEGPTDTHDWPR